jgi:hypothetical protein
MLQMFYLDVAKVNLDVVYICTLQAYLFVTCFQKFRMYVYGCFIWMLLMFAMVFKYFSGVFANVSYACFKCFIRFFYVASRCSKNKSGVTFTHRMRVGRARRHGGRLRRHRSTAGALASPDVLGARSLRVPDVRAFAKSGLRGLQCMHHIIGRA